MVQSIPLRLKVSMITKCINQWGQPMMLETISSFAIGYKIPDFGSKIDNYESILLILLVEFIGNL